LPDGNGSNTTITDDVHAIAVPERTEKMPGAFPPPPTLQSSVAGAAHLADPPRAYAVNGLAEKSCLELAMTLSSPRIITIFFSSFFAINLQ
jgi:hypothetical protein